MQLTNYKCFRVYEESNNFRSEITERPLSELHQEDRVLIRVHYSSLNYKDALSRSGHKGISRQFPHTPGIDAAGVVVSSPDPKFEKGHEVIVTSYDLGMNTDGGFAEYISVPPEWVVPLPSGLSLRESMVMGTAGFTAALALYKMEQGGQYPDMGKILVTGATGGVGTSAIALLRHLNYRVLASTGKIHCHDMLTELGSHEIIDREAVNNASDKPFLSTQWAGAIDTVGGNTLETILKSSSINANIAVCGLVASPNFSTTVYPFIIKGNNLLGIESATTAMKLRQELWRRLANEWKFYFPEKYIKEVTLSELESKIQEMLKSKIYGRIVVNLK